jgi:trk system potassium uptake protein TrkH
VRRLRHPAQIVVAGFGEVVILALIQVGGFGIMTFASLLGLLISRRMACASA